MLHPIHLTKDVAIEGKDYFGRKARIKFSPTDKPGWWWRYDSQQQPILITADIVQRRFHRLTLYYQKARLHIYEHIGVLRFLGLDQIVITSTSWPPYYGRPDEFWQAIKKYCSRNLSSNISWCTVKETLFYRYNSNRNGYLSIKTNNEPCLNIQIICDYKGIGCGEVCHHLPITPLENSFKARSQGWPKWAYYFSLMLSQFGWPTHECINWPQENDPHKTAHQFAVHRLVDLLGALSLIHPYGLLAANIESFCAGHEADMAILKQSKNLLSPL